MNSPNNVKENTDLKTLANDARDPKLKWLSGFFDGKGSCSFMSDNTPVIQILNTNPTVTTIAYAILQKYGITIKVSERSRPSKSSKKKRWDIFSENKSDTQKIASLLSFLVQGKQEQLKLIEDNGNSKDLQYINATNHILINDNIELFKRLGFEKHGHETVSQESIQLVPNEFCDLAWLAGFIDAEGIFKIDSRDMKGKHMAKYTPMLKLTHHNKKSILAALSTLKNLDIGCHINFNVSETQNRGKWTLTISGLKRIKFLGFKLLDHLILRKEQLNLLNLYVHRRLKENPLSIDEMGFSTQNAINEMEKLL